MPMNRPGLPFCFAPPLTEEKLAEYGKLATQARDEAVKDEMLKLIRMMEVFNETPTSGCVPEPIPFGAAINGKLRGVIVKIPLEESEVKRIWDVVPYEHELKALAALFETISLDTQKPLRDAAHHLLWFANELYLDREPMTFDKV